MAPVGAFMVAYGGAIASAMSVAAQGYGMYSQSVQTRLAKGAHEDAMALAATQKKELPNIPGIVPGKRPADPAQREANVEAEIMANRRRMASNVKRKTVATSGAGIIGKATTEKKTLLGQTGALSVGVI